MESNENLSSFEHYNTCKYRDLCLRYLGEEPARWISISSTPCPCNAAYFNEVMAYARVLSNELEGSRLPYTRAQLVRWMTEKPHRARKIKAATHIPLSQQRLQV